MRRKTALIYLSSLVVVAALALGFTFAVGNAPLLGLDLEGGVSVVLQPTSPATDDQLDQAIAIMNQRINSLGVAEPDIHQQGGQIIVQIAGLKDADKDKAIAQVGQTAELRFRPVLAVQQAAPPTTPPGTQATTTGSEPSTTPAPTATDPAVNPSGASDSTTPPTGAASDNQTGMGVGEGETAAGIGAQTTPSTVSDQPAATTPGTTAAPASPSGVPIGPACQALSTATPTAPSTAEQDNAPKSACEQVILPIDPRMVNAGTPATTQYLLGPACQPPEGAADSCLTGSALESARANIDTTGKWIVNPVFKGGAEGIDKFNAISSACYQRAPNCPTSQLAMTLDGYVVSAPTIQVGSFAADQIQISGSFTEETARNLATSLNYGALPVQLKQQAAEQVSATIGRDALTAGIAAGVVGFILVTIYMVAFYRLLGLLAILKLAIEGALLWAIISYLGQTAGLALTLAGVTGIIVSIGVSLDSNVVYYEHLREDLRNGRTLRSAVDRSFSGAIGTIWKADGASLLGAVLLYLLAVGPVRGFAFFLGLSTILDLIGSYFYMHPVVYLSTQSKLCQRRPGLFGLGGAIVAPDEGGRTASPRPTGTVPSRPSKRSGRSGDEARESPQRSRGRSAVALADPDEPPDDASERAALDGSALDESATEVDADGAASDGATDRDDDRRGDA